MGKNEWLAFLTQGPPTESEKMPLSFPFFQPFSQIMQHSFHPIFLLGQNCSKSQCFHSGNRENLRCRKKIVFALKGKWKNLQNNLHIFSKNLHENLHFLKKTCQKTFIFTKNAYSAMSDVLLLKFSYWVGEGVSKFGRHTNAIY